MPEEPSAILDRIREFERTFEQIYRRKMTDDEHCILSAAKKIIEQKLAEYSEKNCRLVIWLGWLGLASFIRSEQVIQHIDRVP